MFDIHFKNNVSDGKNVIVLIKAELFLLYVFRAGKKKNIGEQVKSKSKISGFLYRAFNMVYKASVCKIHDSYFIFIFFTNHSAEAECSTRSIFERSLTSLNSEFSLSSLAVVIPRF